ncbi:MAG: hypothetical protein WA733_01870 [Methylocystis sp.]
MAADLLIYLDTNVFIAGFEGPARAYFVSNDDRLKQLPVGLGKIRADRTGVDKLLRELSL